MIKWLLQFNLYRWDGYFIRKKSFINKSSEDHKVEGEENIIENLDKNDDLAIEEEEKKDKTFVSSWKLSLPDEFVNIEFNNKNSYHGYISRKMMEGEGTYRWHNGIKYQVSNKYMSIFILLRHFRINVTFNFKMRDIYIFYIYLY